MFIVVFGCLVLWLVLFDFELLCLRLVAGLGLLFAVWGLLLSVCLLCGLFVFRFLVGCWCLGFWFVFVLYL